MFSEWIKTKDKLPPINEWVIAYTNNECGDNIIRHLFIDSIDDGKICWLAIDEEWPCEVTHWMPEPEPPKE